MKNIKPIFILGCPRSGTTLLSSLLEYTIYGKPFESHFITKYYKKLSSYGELQDKKNFIRLVDDIKDERYIKQWHLDIDPERLYSELENFDFSTIANHICMIKGQESGSQSWGDKTPHYTLDLEIIYELFPHSKYIFITRDGRDVALSLLEKSWGPNNIMSCAELWKKYHIPSPIIDDLKRNNQLFTLRYEDLLETPEIVVHDLYKFLEQEYSEENVRELTDRIKRNNTNKWQKKLTEQQVKVFENVASKTLQKLGYSVTHGEQPLSPSIKWPYSAHEAVMRSYSLLKLNIIDGIKIRFLGKEPFAE